MGPLGPYEVPMEVISHEITKSPKTIQSWCDTLWKLGGRDSDLWNAYIDPEII